VLDIDNFEAHDAIFQAVYERRHTILWVDEITATGATAQRVQPWLRGISARGRTRGVGLWTCTQAAFSLTPTILRRNATYLIFGPIDQEDARDIPRKDIEIATMIPRGTGRFLVYAAGEPDPYRLHMPIPNQLKAWRAP
jgi:hypoxanthine phosphoribosyltransferase